MTDKIPQIVLGLGADSEYVVMVGEDEAEATTATALLAMAPGLKQPEAALETARALNFLSQGADFTLIEDPTAFEEHYRSKLASEDTSAPWAEGIVRLSDYGVPDFSEIAAPAMVGTVLTFFAADAFIGVPYRISVDLASADIRMTDDHYKALDLEPLDFGETDEMPGEASEKEKELLEILRTGVSD